MKFAFLTNVQSIQLEEGTNASWVHAMGVGTYKHPVHGDIVFTPERITKFADNVNNKVRGVDPDIDYDHKKDPAKGNEAAGWVKKAEARSDGLWLFVDWTKTAVDKIKEKVYRYFSPEFDDEWTDAQGVKHTDVMFGGALTNRPFLKDLVPVNLSELVGDPPVVPNKPKEGDGMDPKLLRQMLKLAENATDEQVQAELKRLSESAPLPPNDPKLLRTTLGLTETATDEEVAAKLKQLTEPGPGLPEGITLEQALASLSEMSSNPATKALTELLEQQNKELNKLHKENKEQRVEKKLAELDALFEGKKFSIPPSVVDHLRFIMLNSPEAVADEVLKQYKQTLELGLIDMTEKGWARRNGESTPGKRFEAAVKQFMEEQKWGQERYADAVQHVSSENPKLYTEYREEAFSFKVD